MFPDARLRGLSTPRVLSVPETLQSGADETFRTLKTSCAVCHFGFGLALSPGEVSDPRTELFDGRLTVAKPKRLRCPESISGLITHSVGILGTLIGGAVSPGMAASKLVQVPCHSP